MKLVITEKPSVARDLARVLGATSKHSGWLEGSGLQITWCFGHMVELEDPAYYNPAWKRWSMDTLPMIPDHFALRLREGVKDQWKVLCRLLQDRSVTEVINACDAGREGELIFRYVYQLAVSSLPVRRLWVSSLTDQAIKGAWSKLQPGARYDTLADAARSRAESDWLVGLNITRAMTCLARSAGGDQLLSVGRVQTPTLAMIVNRDQEIAAFVPEPFWQVKAKFSAEAGEWEGKWFRPGHKEETRKKKGDREAPRAERLPSEAAAEQIINAAKGQQGVVATASGKQIRERPPLLYDLTSLQRRANQRYGYSAQQTLQLAQELYEKHKLISYPRTDARYLTPDQVPELPGILKGLCALPVYDPYCQPLLAAPIKPGKRVVNAAEVGDHHAILPTGRAPRSSRLSLEEKRIFDLIARRLIAALSPDALFDISTLIVHIPPAPQAPLPAGITGPLCFRARGRLCRQAGWRDVDPPGKSKQLELPPVHQGDATHTEALTRHKGQTRPPRPHSDASILLGMETAGRELDDVELKRAMRGAGLGTPATRAAILQTLLSRQYITRRGRELRATERGTALIKAVPVDSLKSAELTGIWEARLNAIAEGSQPRSAFMSDVKASLKEMVAAIAAAEPPPPERSAAAGPELGKCPLCSTPVHEKHSVYDCQRGRACSFVIFKTIAKRRISARTVKALLRDGRSPVLKRFKSKKGKLFSAALALNDEGRVIFDFSDVESSASSRAPAAGKTSPPLPAPPPAADKTSPPLPAPPPAAHAPGPSPTSAAVDPVGLLCPRCQQGRIIRGRRAWGCDRWREGCRFTLTFDDNGRARSPAEAARLIQQALQQ